MVLRVITALLFIYRVAGMSALRFGPDSSSNDISIVYSKDFNHYNLVLQKSFYYMSLPFTLCFRLRPLLSQGSTCLLSNETGAFDCLARDTKTLKYMAWTLSNDLQVKSNLQSFEPSSASEIVNTLSVQVSLQGILGAENKSFSILGKPNSIFEVLVSDSYNPGSDEAKIKRAYVSTFYEAFRTTSNNLIMPTQIECSIYEGIVNLVFLGRRYRQGTDYYIAAFINYNPIKQSFLMWEGLSFSKNKVNRDMMGVYPSLGLVEDLFSLYKTAPFLDTSSNINGTNDWIVMASSETINDGKPNWFYYTQAYRLLKTQDSAGDEVLMFKVGNQYCYAAYFDTNITIGGTLQQTAFTQKDSKHQLLKCFLPDLTLSSLFVVPLFLMVFFII